MTSTMTGMVREPAACCMRVLQIGVFALLLAWMSPSAWAQVTLQVALERAWERAVQARVATSRGTEAEATQLVAKAWFPGAPSVGVSEKSDRLDRHQGAREREIELAVPLWLAGQRSAWQVLAERDMQDAQAAVASARLNVAGELRVVIWSAVQARAAARIAAERVATALALEAEVVRREQAGDLARTDLLLMQEEVLGARVAQTEADMRMQQALTRYRLLTGLTDLPLVVDEALAPVPQEPHPRVRLAQAAVARARAQVQVVVAERFDAPALSLAIAQTREASSAASAHTVRLGLRMALGSQARHAPRLAAANAELVRAEAQWLQTQVELESEQREALAALEAAERVLQVRQERTQRVVERLTLQKKAFRLGELSAAEFMRVQAAADLARLEFVGAQQALAAACAQVNQARGMLP